MMMSNGNGSVINPETRLSVLNVGTRILLKDIMDHNLRQIGNIITHYAPNIASALRMFRETQVHVLISEVEMTDGSVYRLLKEIGGAAGPDDDLYFVLALEDHNDQLMALAEELESHAVIMKPFAAVDLAGMMEKYENWRVMPKEPWRLLLGEARQATIERRYRDAVEHYKNAIVSAPNNPTPLLRAAQFFIGRSDYSLAEGMLKKALLVKPNFVQGHAHLGTVYLARRDLEKAQEHLAKAQALSPLNPDRGVDLVKLLVERAIEGCRSTVRLDPGGTEASLLLGKLLALQRDYVGAVREFEKLMPGLRESARAEAQTFAALSRKLGHIQSK
jgi:tetratricopeptide (TPR) repeat protein